MDLAVKEILRESNTNFYSLIKNIENNRELKNLVKRLILDNDEVTYIVDNPVINIGIIYGIFKNENNKMKVNNIIYEQRICNYMSSPIETSVNIGYYNQKSAYIKEDDILDIRRILVKFSEFMKHEYSEKRI